MKFCKCYSNISLQNHFKFWPRTCFRLGSKLSGLRFEEGQLSSLDPGDESAHHSTDGDTLAHDAKDADDGYDVDNANDSDDVNDADDGHDWAQPRRQHQHHRSGWVRRSWLAKIVQQVVVNWVASSIDKWNEILAFLQNVAIGGRNLVNRDYKRVHVLGNVFEITFHFESPI